MMLWENKTLQEQATNKNKSKKPDRRSPIKNHLIEDQQIIDHKINTPKYFSVVTRIQGFFLDDQITTTH